MANKNTRAAIGQYTKTSCVALNNGHIEGKGEDANPIAIVSPSNQWGAIAVFDGMGGAGSTKRTTPEGEMHTEAYLASRFVRDIVKARIASHYNPNLDNNELADYIKCELSAYKEELGIQPSLLKSSLTRTLPTTLSMATWSVTEHGFDIYTYSAGDSRCYLIDEQGLKQITVDHIRGGGDAMVSLHDDPPMSNTISESKSFYIDKKVFLNMKPCILISCTDGCFGFLESPMHFEKMLLDTMFSAENEDEWAENIKQFLLPVSGDDFSFAISILGHSFDYWKGFLQHHYKQVEDTCMLYTLADTDEEKTAIWETYKMDYEKLAPTSNF